MGAFLSRSLCVLGRPGLRQQLIMHSAPGLILVVNLQTLLASGQELTGAAPLWGAAELQGGEK